jgi:DNA polymerase elongation subunit (family B)
MHNAQVVEPVSMLCFASKWVGEKTIEFHSVNGSKAAEDALRFDVAFRAWNILDECDALVTYNGDRYDIPHLYREFALAGLGPPSPFKSIDLFRVAKRLKFFSHKLDYVADQLQLGRKLDTGGFKLWLDVMAGDEKAWRKFERYNKHDVKVTEALYKDLLPWIKVPLNLNLFRDGEGCPRCDSKKTPQKRGFRYTGITKFQRYFCTDCQGWSTDGKAIERAGLRVAS